MSKENPSNIAASVRARLLNIARSRGEEYEQLLTRFCMERFLYRLSRSGHAGRFLLKGAMLFVVWEGQIRRPTRDLDLLGFGKLTEETLQAIITEACAVACPEDGVKFAASTIKVAPIREEQVYSGLRVTFEAHLGSARARCQVDVGVGDAVTPEPVEQEFPTLLDLPRPRLRMYPRETVVAEKLEAMVQLGVANSRMKDFFDLWHMACTFAFDGAVLVTAVRGTFDRRGTALPTDAPVALTAEFITDRRKLTQWTAFLRAAKATEPVWKTLIKSLQPFLLPLVDSARQSKSPGNWPPGGPWA